MRDYELVVLYHPDLEIDLDKALKKIEGLIKDSDGKVSYSDNWGKRRLAYPIAKQDYAIYVYYEVQLDRAGVAKLEGLFNITDEVIRFLLTKPTPNFGDREKSKLDDDKEEDEGEKKEKDSKEKKAKSKPTDVKDEDSKEE